MAIIDIASPGASEALLNAAITDLGTPDFSGALLGLSSTLTAQNYQPGVQVPLNNTIYDVGGWVSGATLVVPSGVSAVGIEGSVRVTATTIGQNGSAGILRNGSGLWNLNTSTYGVTYQMNTDSSFRVWSHFFPVTAGQAFSLWFASGGDMSIDVQAGFTHLKIWKVS